KETIVADQRDVVVQWSQAAEMLISIRPFGAWTMPLFQPWPAGSERIVVRRAKRPLRRPLKASTRPSDVTYSLPRYQSRPSGPRTPAMTFCGRAPDRATM